MADAIVAIRETYKALSLLICAVGQSDLDELDIEMFVRQFEIILCQRAEANRQIKAYENRQLPGQSHG